MITSATATHQPGFVHPAAGPTSAASSREHGVSQAPSANALRQEHNAAILGASLQVSLQSGNDGLSLLYRSAIEHLNEVLAPGQGLDVIGQAALEQDNSPEATAERILGFATGFFEAYAARHPGKNREALATDFVNLVRGGFEKGFNEARDILQGLGVLGGSAIEQGIYRTHELVMKGFDDFLASKLEALADKPSQLPD